jgi:hypothetical protein
MTLTHARCGGVLVPIPVPDWAPRRAVGSGTVPPPDYARCDRCQMPGEVVETEKHPAL